VWWEKVEISGVSAASNIRKTLCVGSVYNENRTDAEESSGDVGIDGSVGLPLPTECRSFSSVCGTEWGNLTNFQVCAVLSEGTSRILVRSRWPTE
jgi:hypothetical protein